MVITVETSKEEQRGGKCGVLAHRAEQEVSSVCEREGRERFEDIGSAVDRFNGEDRWIKNYIDYDEDVDWAQRNNSDTDGPDSKNPPSPTDFRPVVSVLAEGEEQAAMTTLAVAGTESSAAIANSARELWEAVLVDGGLLHSPSPTFL